MGTRGLFGFFFRGKYYVFWNNHDSYYEGLGQLIIDELKEAGILALFMRLLEHIVEEIHVMEGSDKTKVQCTIHGADAADVTLCMGMRGPFAQALSRGFDGGALELCCSPDSPPDIDNCFVEYSYFINLDEMKLLVYHKHVQYFRLSYTEQTIPDDWIELLEEPSHIPYCNLPHPGYFLETAIAAMAERGYVFQRWISKRSIENVIGEFNRSTSEPSIAIKLYFGESMQKKEQSRLPRTYFDFDSVPLVNELCRDREQAVAALLLESQAASADHPLSIVPIVEIIHRGPSAHDVAGVVMYLAPSDLASHPKVERKVAPADGGNIIDTTAELKYIRTVLTQLKTWVSDLLLAVKWFHDRDLILMDFKQENVLVHENGHLLLCDFETVCKQSPQCAAKLYPRHKVADEAALEGGEGMGAVDEASVNKILQQASWGHDRWVSGWSPLKTSKLAPGFEKHEGTATVLQDYFCLGDLLQKVCTCALLQLLDPYIEIEKRPVEEKSTLSDADAFAAVADARIVKLLDFVSPFLISRTLLDALNFDHLSWAEVETLVHGQVTSVVDQALVKVEEGLMDA